MAWADQIPKLPISRPNLINSQQSDIHLSRVREILALPSPLHPSKGKEELPEVKQLLRYQPNLILEEDVLVLETDTQMDQITGRNKKIVVPLSLQELVFEISHSMTGSGHFGFGPSLSRAKSTFFFVGMADYFRKKIAQCKEGRCQLKGRGYKSKNCQYTPRRAGGFNEEVHVDLLGPIQADGGYHYILGVECLYSRYLVPTPLRKKTAQATCKAILSQWIAYFGPLKHLHIDEGGEFLNALFKELCQALEVEHTFAHQPRIVL